MSRNTASLVRSLQAAPKVPDDGHERAFVNWVRANAAGELAELTSAQIGNAMMHFVVFFDYVIGAVGNADPMLDWESRTNITRNILGVAGMELYTGTELGR